MIVDLRTSEVLGKAKTPEDSDGIICDDASGKVQLDCGDAGVMVPISPDVDPKLGSADPAAELGSKP